MNVQPELTEVCGRCGYIVQAGWGHKEYVSFTVCNGCADAEGAERQAEMETMELEREWMKNQETHVGEGYGY